MEGPFRSHMLVPRVGSPHRPASPRTLLISCSTRADLGAGRGLRADGHLEAAGPQSTPTPPNKNPPGNRRAAPTPTEFALCAVN